MGTRGPVPKRTDQRRRTNKPDVPVKTAPRGMAKKAPAKKSAPKKAPAKKKVTATIVGDPYDLIPAPNDNWHPIALDWYSSLVVSGQSEFYEQSDWMTAKLIAESMSRDLGSQVVGVTEKGEILRDTIPLKGASLSAYLRAFAVLGVTEGDRRRMMIELDRGPKVDADADRAEASITQLHSRLG